MKKLTLILGLIGNFFFNTFASQKIVGDITNSHGEPVVGAIVSTSSSSTAVFSDIYGHFRLEIEPGDTLNIIIKGETFQFATDTRKRYKIKIEGLNINKPQETINIGYQEIDEDKRTNAMGKISRSRLAQTGKANLIEALIALNELNEGPSGYYIRGIGSYTNSNPLFVIDGTSTQYASFILVNDVETVEIIKDGTANIYGNQGANGVILITTRKK